MGPDASSMSLLLTPQKLAKITFFIGEIILMLWQNLTQQKRVLAQCLTHTYLSGNFSEKEYMLKFLLCVTVICQSLVRKLTS